MYIQKSHHAMLGFALLSLPLLLLQVFLRLAVHLTHGYVRCTGSFGDVPFST